MEYCHYCSVSEHCSVVVQWLGCQTFNHVLLYVLSLNIIAGSGATAAFATAFAFVFFNQPNFLEVHQVRLTLD